MNSVLEKISNAFLDVSHESSSRATQISVMILLYLEYVVLTLYITNELGYGLKLELTVEYFNKLFNEYYIVAPVFIYIIIYLVLSILLYIVIILLFRILFWLVIMPRKYDLSKKNYNKLGREELIAFLDEKFKAIALDINERESKPLEDDVIKGIYLFGYLTQLNLVSIVIYYTIILNKFSSLSVIWIEIFLWFSFLILLLVCVANYFNLNKVSILKKLQQKIQVNKEKAWVS